MVQMVLHDAGQIRSICGIQFCVLEAGGVLHPRAALSREYATITKINTWATLAPPSEVPISHLILDTLQASRVCCEMTAGHQERLQRVQGCPQAAQRAPREVTRAAQKTSGRVWQSSEKHPIYTNLDQPT